LLAAAAASFASRLTPHQRHDAQRCCSSCKTQTSTTNKTMTLFVGLLAVALVVGQLDTVQHAALMTVYDALGALVDKRKKTFFAFFFTSVVQAATTRRALAS
jgi:hypothetical protein